MTRSRAGDEVHRAAHALDHLAGDHPVGEVARLGDLHRAEDGEVDVAAADHREASRRCEKIAEPGMHRDGLLAGVDEVGVDRRPRAGTGRRRACRSRSGARPRRPAGM